jgi:uncharacterized protein YcbK (DUF882 family)
MLMQDSENSQKKTVNRRDLLKGIGAACAVAAVPTVANARSLVMPDNVGAYELSFRNQHTNESFSGIYRVGDRYLPSAFKEINYILRDFRMDEVFPVDPRVVDIMFMMKHKIGTTTPFEILSGYRCPKTNAMLSRRGSGVARNSLHMTGQAIDLRLPGWKTSYLKKIARNLRSGGVGYYPKSNFVHIDTGKVRSWVS